MNIVRPSSADEYLLSFWTREKEKPCGQFHYSPEKRLEAILGQHPYKFPCEGKKSLEWHICQIGSVQELENLWMHKSDDWLKQHKLWPGSLWLKDLARNAIDTGLLKSDQDNGSCGENYWKWKSHSLKDQLSGHERPLLVRHPFLTDIVDGFGRLLPFLALVNEGMEFHPFETYLAVPQA